MFSLKFLIFTSFGSMVLEKSLAVPPDACFATFRWEDCGLPAKPVMYYYKSGSRCEVGLWKGCLPNQNMFEDEYECVRTCIFADRVGPEDYHEIHKVDTTTEESVPTEEHETTTRNGTTGTGDTGTTDTGKTGTDGGSTGTGATGGGEGSDTAATGGDNTGGGGSEGSTATGGTGGGSDDPQTTPGGQTTAAPA